MLSDIKGKLLRSSSRLMPFARKTYGATLGSRHRAGLNAAIQEWTQLRPTEQRFNLAHLLYLFLEGQEAQRVLLRGVIDRLEELIDLQEEQLEMAVDSKKVAYEEDDRDYEDGPHGAGEGDADNVTLSPDTDHDGEGGHPAPGDPLENTSEMPYTLDHTAHGSQEVHHA